MLTRPQGLLGDRELDLRPLVAGCGAAGGRRPSERAASARGARLHRRVRRPEGGLEPFACRSARAPRRLDRPERRRQDDRVQPDHRRSTRRPRARSSSTGRTSAGRRPAQVEPRCGIARTFQNIRLFANLTVLDNVLHRAATQRSTAGLVAATLRTPAHRAAESERARARRCALLDELGLEHARRRAWRQAAVRRAAPARDRPRARHRPRLLLLDEPAAGMNPRRRPSSCD